MTHIIRSNSRNKQGEYRTLSDVCKFCVAKINEPCKRNDKFYCPDSQCVRLYDSEQSALNCHIVIEMAKLTGERLKTSQFT